MKFQLKVRSVSLRLLIHINFALAVHSRGKIPHSAGVPNHPKMGVVFFSGGGVFLAAGGGVFFFDGEEGGKGKRVKASVWQSAVAEQ